ncbi:MAG: GTP-binding protein [Pseudomonadota bacterium]
MSARCTLITGLLGAGKTTLILRLLEQRPASERWAILVNDFGTIGIDGTTMSGNDHAAGIVIREVAGGCICCAANVPLRAGIVDVLRRTRPHRLLIEPSGLGHPASILAILATQGIAEALQIGPVVCVADPRDSIFPPGVNESIESLRREQLSIADVVVVNKCDLASEAELSTFVDRVGALYPPKQAIITAVEGHVPLTILDAKRSLWRPAVAGEHFTGTTPALAAPLPVAGIGTRHGLHARGIGSLGWLFDEFPDLHPIADADSIERLIMRLASIVSLSNGCLLRAKGALRTSEGSRLVEWSSGHVRNSGLAFAGPSRFELLFSGPDSYLPETGRMIAEAVEPLLRHALANDHSDRRSSLHERR